MLALDAADRGLEGLALEIDVGVGQGRFERTQLADQGTARTVVHGLA
ncbi:hypothetical protein [Methylobacterium marchantiae]|uniref:Uncharacterized protein n=1 Tax=Methylobacterium marchantiae TaxID=600331 RepID=A0ABW3X4P6_9HYPH